MRTGSRKRAVLFDSTQCKIHIETPKDCVLLLAVDGRSPKHFEEPLLRKIRASCSEAYHLELFLDLEKATALPVATAAWISFINEHAASFGHIYILATTKENILSATIVQHLVNRKDLITVIEERAVFDACFAQASQS